ncbi:biotin/lipoyl-containing protein [Parachitinimonas caeni]|uniref:Lipoyl-binding domain-containing protein n=1 Tax=Parachitinimonas caeni TaxID=3031301 RepID=A0ABT7DR43_9NEIS|nr:biotin/lipoyl-containing protein [Parachitinimonas caeni]MDK2122531.1 hypothetical protein [Parachitinimonas caeni]
MPTTLHLVCAPEEIVEDAVVASWHVRDGQLIEVDAPLVRLISEGRSVEISAPVGGVLSECCVAVGDLVAVNDLLAMIEAEEEAFGEEFLLAEGELVQPSTPSCRLVYPRDPAFLATHEALMWAQALGVSVEGVEGTGPEGQVQLIDVQRHVRLALEQLDAIRRLLWRH